MEGPIFARRDILSQGGAVGLTGLSWASGLVGRSSPVWAADSSGSLPQVNILNPAGELTLAEQSLMASGGYFAEFGLAANIVNVADGSKILAALISGNGDIGCGSGFSGLFAAIEKGAKIKVLAGAQLSPTDGIVTKNPDIKSVKDLAGRTIGVGAPGALLHEMTVGLLEKKGIDWHKVTFVNIGSSTDVFKAVVAGTVDAGPVEVQFFTLATKFGVRQLSDGALWDELSLYTNNGMFASDKAIAEKRDILVRTMAAHAKLFRFISSPGSKDVFIKNFTIAVGGKNAEEDAEELWKFLQPKDRLATDLVLSDERINYVQQLNVELGVQKSVLPISQVADMSLARDALKLLKS